MENFKPEAFRKELAEDLKTIRKVDPEAAKKVLENEQETRSYNVARAETILDRKEEERRYQELLMSPDTNYGELLMVAGRSGERYNEISDLIVKRLGRLMVGAKENPKKLLDEAAKISGLGIEAVNEKIKSPEMIQALTDIGVIAIREYLSTGQNWSDIDKFHGLVFKFPELRSQIVQVVLSDKQLMKAIKDIETDSPRSNAQRYVETAGVIGWDALRDIENMSD